MSKPGYAALLAVAVGLAYPCAEAPAAPPATSIGSAVVDGDAAEWNFGVDFFTNLYRAGNPNKPLESKAYLRYDCATRTVFALVLDEPGIPGLIVSGETTSWVAINAVNTKAVNEHSGDDGTPPDFAWIGLGYDGNPLHMRGYEASFALAEGDYAIWLHTEVFDGGKAQTSASPGSPGSGVPLHLACLSTTGTENTSWSKVKRLYR